MTAVTGRRALYWALRVAKVTFHAIILFIGICLAVTACFVSILLKAK